jgi:heptosyltransferase I
MRWSNVGWVSGAKPNIEVWPNGKLKMVNRFNLPADIRKILIIKPSALGDVIHGLPVLQALHSCFAESEIHWVVARGFHEILEGHPLIHKLWIIDKNSWKEPAKALATFTELKRLAAGLRREKFDLVVDLQGLFRSAMIGLFTGTKERAGFENAREGAKFSYKYRIRTDAELHAVDKNMQLARALGCDAGDPVFSFPPLDLAPELSRLLPSEYAVFAPSAGTLVKRWPAANFGYLASKLPIPAIIVGGKSDVALANEIAAFSRGRAVSLAGKTSLKGLAAIIKGAKFLVTADSGPMHIAAALNIPVFAIFGPTNPVRTGPYGKIHTIIRSDLPCSPCYKRKPCDDWKCMSGITVEFVANVIANAETSLAALPKPPHNF